MSKQCTAMAEQEQGRCQQRIAAARDAMANAGVSALIVTGPQNVKFLTGFIWGKNAYLLLDPEEVTLFTRTTEYEQARAEAPLCKAVQEEGVHTREALLAQRIREAGHSRIGYEPASLTALAHEDLTCRLGPSAELIAAGQLISELWIRKDETELDQIRQACQIFDRTMEAVLPRLRVGMSELEASWEFQHQAIAEGADGFWFPSIVLSGPRSALPHGAPSYRKIQPGDFLKIDLGPTYCGYPSDATRTVVFGPVDKKQELIYRIVHDAQAAALDAVAAGRSCKSVHEAAAQPIAKAGYGDAFNHSVGHGVWGPPSVGPNDDVPLEENMVITVEPGIYLPGWGGVRIEDTVRVTETGAEILHAFTKELLIIE